MSTSSISQTQLIAEYRQFVQECEVQSFCGRQFIRIRRLREWMEPRKSDLLFEAYRRREPWEQPSIHKIWDDPNGAWLVFAILLEINHGDLIDLFLRLGFRNLPIPRDMLRQQLAQYAVEPHFTREEVDRIVELVDKRQFAFCPVHLDIGHDKYYSERYILPIHSRKVINHKGGTASIWQVEILEEFLEPGLRRVLERSRFESDANPPGIRYKLAVKTFAHKNLPLYLNEISAFAALQENKGMIQYLGHFAQRNGDIGKSEYNILLEYGDFDLEEHFELHVPPVLPAEILKFWTNLFEVARAIEKVHKIETRRGDRQQEYFGWHADIKPANILLVQERLKLADPGFARFERAARPDQETHIMGGTLTWGAPELSLHNHHPKPVSQAIDIWSFGCVLSIAASWVVLGVEGIKQFSRIRTRATQGISNSAEHGRPKNMPSAGDFFHDGEDVLLIVKLWHGHLRESQRESDPITSRVLNLVDSALLCTDPKRRIHAPELCRKLDQMLKSCGEEQLKPLDPILQEAFVAVESDASYFITERNSLRASAAIVGENPNPESSKASRFDYSKRPVKKTTYRAEVLNMKYSSTERGKLLAAIQELSQTPSQAATPPDTSASSAQWQRPEPVEIQQSRVSHRSHRTFLRPESSLTVTERSRSQSQQHRDQSLQIDTSSTSNKHAVHDIFTAREEAKKSHKKLGSIFKRDRPGDAKLKQHFDERDIHFLVDNADSMVSHWAHAKFLLTTLVRKANGVDDNGMDLSFTNGPVKLRNSNDHKKFKGKMEQNGGKPLDDANKPTHTDILKSLGEIMEEYRRRASMSTSVGKNVRKLTVIILTDGLWEARQGDYEGVANKIIAFQQHLKKAQGGSLRDRQVTFQFIQFGLDRKATLWLKRLDEELKGPDVEDIVDTEHAYDDVYKMFLGSFEKFYDEREGGDGSISPLLRQATSPRPSMSETPT